MCRDVVDRTASYHGQHCARWRQHAMSGMDSVSISGSLALEKSVLSSFNRCVSQLYCNTDSFLATGRKSVLQREASGATGITGGRR